MTRSDPASGDAQRAWRPFDVLGGPLPVAARTAVVAALAIDLLLLGGNLLFLLHDEPAREPVHPVFSNPAWNGDTDRSFLEIAGAVQLVAAVGLLLLLWVKLRQPVYAAWALVFGWMIADDLLTLHELGGSALVEAWSLPAPFGFSPQYLGETLVWALVAPVLLIVVWATHRNATERARRDSRILMAGAGLLLAFALVVDTIVVLLDSASPMLRTGMVLTETGGEVLTMTLVLACVLAMAARMTRSARPTAG